MEFHCLSNKYIVVANRFHVNLRAGQECFDAEYIYDHAAFGTTLNIALYNFFVIESLINAIPGLESTSFLMRKKKLTFLILQTFYINFYYITNFYIGIVTKVADGNYAVAFVTYIYNSLTFVKSNNFAFYNFVLTNLV